MSLRSLARRAAVAVGTSDRVEHVVVATPLVRGVALRRALRYVAGLDERAALLVVERLSASGLGASVDLFGENTDDAATADAIVGRYLALAAAISAYPGTYLSLDCSHVGLERDPQACGSRVERIAASLPAGAYLQLGAEQAARADAILEIAYRAAAAGARVMATVQANLRRSADDIERLAAAGIPVRLVKGAYVERPDQAYAWGPATDGAYASLADRLEQLRAPHSLATHDPVLLAPLLAGRAGRSVEVLLGVAAGEARQLAASGQHVRVYVPYGERWFRYYARRTAESIGA